MKSLRVRVGFCQCVYLTARLAAEILSYNAIKREAALLRQTDLRCYLDDEPPAVAGLSVRTAIMFQAL
jgi:hypothetical protein